MKRKTERELCQRRKMGEYNDLRCYRTAGHEGNCCFAVDWESDAKRQAARERRR